MFIMFCLHFPMVYLEPPILGSSHTLLIHMAKPVKQTSSASNRRMLPQSRQLQAAIPQVGQGIGR
jgi:hypothetical protein